MNLEKYRKILYQVDIWSRRNNASKILGIFNGLSVEERSFRLLNDVFQALGDKDATRKINCILNNKNRKAYRRAGFPWTQEEDERLIDLFLNQRLSIHEISRIHERSVTAINMRLDKLELLEITCGCDCCEKSFSPDLLTELENGSFCEDCIEGEMRVCDVCDKLFIIDEMMIRFDSALVCKDCYDMNEGIEMDSLEQD